MIDALIFSRNRPLQLHGLLSSLKRFTNLKPDSLSVLHRYDPSFKDGLDVLKTIHKDVKFLEEEDFESQVKSYLKSGQDLCTFFVDDMIVKDEVDFNIPRNIMMGNPEILTVSLRLGTHLTHCYPTSTSQSVPNGNVNSQFFVWKWRGAHYDWGYPFSVDGHIFRRSEIEGWSSHLRFKNPNQFESSLQEIPHIFRLPEIACCYLNSRIFNVPMNRVQHEFKNKNEESSVDDLYKLWMDGKEIDVTVLKGFMNVAAHHPIDLPLKDRTR